MHDGESYKKGESSDFGGSGFKIVAPPLITEADAQSNGCIATGTATASLQFTCKLHVDYVTEDLARVVMVTLSVDPELRPKMVRRDIKVEGRRLLVSFAATEARSLRASFTAFMDMLILATRTVEEFGPGTMYMP